MRLIVPDMTAANTFLAHFGYFMLFGGLVASSLFAKIGLILQVRV
jgi:hypothetical protein